MAAARPAAEAAEHERQFREMLEFCPGGAAGRRRGRPAAVSQRAAARTARLRKDELERIDTSTFWHDLEQRARIIASLREQGGQLLNEKVVWRTKNGQLLHLLLSYVQVAYQGGHISFVGGKRVLWVYDITALTQHETQVVEQERQLREILDYCPAAVCVVDEDGRILFHNRRMRDLLGLREGRAGAVRHQAVLARPRSSNAHHRAAAYARRPAAQRRGGLEDQAGRTAQSADLLCAGRLCRRPCRGGRRQAAVLALRHHAAAARRAGAAAQRAAARRGDREHLRRLRLLRRRGPAGHLQLVLPQPALSRPGHRSELRARRSRASSAALPSAATSRMRKAASRNGSRNGCGSTAIRASRRCSGAATAAG